MTDDTLRPCSKCGRRLPSSMFNRNRGGLRPDCKDCRRVQSAEYWVREGEARRAYGREYYRIHKEQSLARQRRYKAEDHVRYMWQRIRINAGDSPGHCTLRQYRDLVESAEGRCEYCRAELGGHWATDHRLPKSRGGSNNVDNLAIVCPTCNLRKGTKTEREFRLWLYGAPF